MIRRLVCALALVTATAARADDGKAKQLYDEGLRHYNIAEYKDAIAAWKQSYLISKAPLLLFNIAQAYRLSGDCAQAMKFYDSYQREEPSPSNQEELEQATALCKDKVQASPKPPPVETRPTTPVEPASHAEKPPAPATEPGHGHTRTIGMFTLVAGGVLGITGGYFAYDGHKLAAQNAKDFNNGTWGPEQVNAQDKGQRDNTFAWIFGGAGVAAIGVGVALVVMGGHADEHAVAVAPTRGGATVGWGFRF